MKNRIMLLLLFFFSIAHNTGFGQKAVNEMELFYIVEDNAYQTDSMCADFKLRHQNIFLLRDTLNLEVFFKCISSLRKNELQLFSIERNDSLKKTINIEIDRLRSYIQKNSFEILNNRTLLLAMDTKNAVMNHIFEIDDKHYKLYLMKVKLF
jgi:hypothetical protein